MSFEEDFAAGQLWATTVRAILDRHIAKRKSKRNFEESALLMLYVYLDIWNDSPRNMSLNLMKYHKDAMLCGRVDLATLSLRMSWTYKLLGGEQLALIQQGSEERLKEIVGFHASFPEIDFVST